jgi:hypothetical protein
MDNFSRMIQLATEFFDTKNDSSQLSIDESVMERLHTIHPASMGEITDSNGPIAWTIVIPTTQFVMDRFIAKKINERQLMDETLQVKIFEAVYLCSALVLPEYRGRGLAKELLCNSITSVQYKHHIRNLFYWAFSTEGDSLALATAKELRLPLYKRIE